MGNVNRPKPIRLSNRTAIGLRKTAQHVRSAWLIAMCVFTMLSVVLAVYLGLSWLPAIPLTPMAAGCVIALMMIISRSQYLMLISQAICTESASRQMEERVTEQKRRERAIEQLAAMRADVREAQKKGFPGAPQRGEESLLFDLLTGRDPSEAELLKKRRDEEDDELYAVSYAGDENAEADAQADLYPPKKSKKAPEAPVRSMPMQTSGTKPVKKAESAPAKEAPAAHQDEPGAQAHRRRRRTAPAAPLQLIRGDQAQ